MVLTCAQCPAQSLPSYSVHRQHLWQSEIQSHLERSFTATTNSLFLTTPLPCVLRNVPVAALDHLRGGESIFPLPQPASSSRVQFTLRNLLETKQDVDPSAKKA